MKKILISIGFLMIAPLIAYATTSADFILKNNQSSNIDSVSVEGVMRYWYIGSVNVDPGCYTNGYTPFPFNAQATKNGTKINAINATGFDVNKCLPENGQVQIGMFISSINNKSVGDSCSHSIALSKDIQGKAIFSITVNNQGVTCKPIPHS